MFDTPTLASMPIATDAKSVVTMRQAVISYECGTGRRRVARVHRRKGQGASGEAAGSAAPRKTTAHKGATPKTQ
jgi:hypothetical protein